MTIRWEKPLGFPRKPRLVHEKWFDPPLELWNWQILQGLVSVPFWEYWISPKKVAIIDHIPFMVG